jgi:hypothetical protein
VKSVTCTSLDIVRIEIAGEARALNIPAAAVLRMRDTQAALIAALRMYLEVLPAFRGKPVGAPGSAARTTHDLHAVAEQMALDAIAKAEGGAT